MPPKCSVCTHPKRVEIDKALAADNSYRRIATRFDVSAESLRRHKNAHLPKEIAKAQKAGEIAIADDLLGQVKELRNRAISILGKAEQAGDYRTALQGIREARACIELLLEVEGELDRRGVVNIVISPEWVQVRTLIIAALQPYPEARQSVTTALQSIEGGKSHAVA